MIFNIAIHIIRKIKKNIFLKGVFLCNSFCLVVVFVLLNSILWAQVGRPNRNGLPANAVLQTDTAKKIDHSSNVTVDSNVVQKEETKAGNGIDQPVEYMAIDSIVFDVKEKKTYLYGEASVMYGDIDLKAAYIALSMEEKELFASGVVDTSGAYTYRPDFKDGEQGFLSDSIKYNFDTKKGKIFRAKTQDGDSYIHGEQIKKVSDDVMYIKHGKFTTCSSDTPHFHIQANKLKIIKNDKVITGPANLKVADVPTPLAVPFGFFPNKQGKKSGIIIPQYGESPQYGFYLLNGGYYWAINDKLDAKFMGDIYSHGSFALKNQVRYQQRYKFNGNFDVDYSVFRESERQFPDFQQNKNFSVKWNHNQDAKANPYGNFQANVNVASSKNYQNNFNSSLDDYVNSNMASNIRYTRNLRIFGKSAQLGLNATHDLKTRDSIVNITLPKANFNVVRFFPLKRKLAMGKSKWYEQIGMTYNAEVSNKLRTKQDSNFFSKQTLNQFNSGFLHNIPISTSFKMLRYLSLNPTLNYRGVAYFETYNRSWDSDLGQEKIDTVPTVAMFHEASANASLNTVIYGMYQFKGKKVSAMRHVMTPSVSFNYIPNYADTSLFNYYTSYIKKDAEGVVLDTVLYSPYGGGIYGAPNRGEQGSIGFSLNNNFEIKYKNKSDTIVKDRKRKILENVRIASTYNFLADSMALSNISFGGNIKPASFFDIRINGVLDPYQMDFLSQQRVNRFQVDEFSFKEGEFRLARMTSLNVALVIQLRGKRTDGKTQNQDLKSKYGSEQELAYINDHLEEFIDFNIPWDFNVRYNLRYSKMAFSPEILNTLEFDGSANVTNSWKVGVRTGYDIKKKDFTLTSFNLVRDLHCWELRFNVVPFGARQSYQLDIQVKSALLQDLKLSRKRNPNDF